MPANPLKPILVCFSHLRWSFVWQRPQHLLSRAARAYRVIFVEDPLIATGGAPRLDLSHGPGAVTVAVPVLPEALGPEQRKAARRMLVDDLLESMGGPVAVSWYYTPMALEIYDHVESEVCVYDCMDELSGFRGAPPELRRYEAALFRRADVVFTGGRSLYEAKRRRHPNVHCCPSSIDAAHFRQARGRPAGPEPADQSGIGRPRIGFFGVIDERMDTALLAEMADLQPGWQFVMIGPVVKIDAGDLPHRPNIHWLGPKRYEELPAYLSRWDLGFMPFAINEATRYISPTKTPEFLAAGLPVVSTPVADVVRTYGGDGHVEIAADAREMAAKAAMLLGRPRARWLARVDRRLAAMSWDSTWRRMSEEIDLVRDSRSAAKPPVTRFAASGAGEVSRV
ncbi:MAG: glycosyltransferase family 1 protein [Hyphomicrobiaceae bacterium]|nr:glycosyltransferase family 1 protein [Hyphomicrobiaceae bacterium]